MSRGTRRFPHGAYSGPVDRGASLPGPHRAENEPPTQGDNQLVSTSVLRIRSPVAWIAGRRETEFLKPIDKVSLGEIASHRAVTQVNAQVASTVYSEGRARNPGVKGSMGGRKLIETADPLRRGDSGSTMTRTGRATGETLLAPVRNHRSKVGSITGNTGKWAEGERAADGRVVAWRRGNARGAKAPCCWRVSDNTEGQDGMIKPSSGARPEKETLSQGEG